ncbi:unnamed protein product [Paramecium pentaurelia]|uniref:Uncharacterized protein n=1 Tax=Paramecium pentaurelia TaxID=43138 RepID=A0A8S1UYZ5_9CILI|nr:unnamed protein product [Paramecium pentaurelia]
MNIKTPETIKATQSNCSNSTIFQFTVEKIDFSNPKQLLLFKSQLAHLIIKK